MNSDTFQKELTLLQKKYDHKLKTINNEYNIRFTRLNSAFRYLLFHIDESYTYKDDYHSRYEKYYIIYCIIYIRKLNWLDQRFDNKIQKEIFIKMQELQKQNIKQEIFKYKRKNIEKKVRNQLNTYMYQLHILIYKHENRKRKLESELYNKKLELIRIINVTLLSGNNYNIYNSLYDFIQDLKKTFNNEKEYAILYKDVRIHLSSIIFLDSINEIETIDLQLIILNNEIKTID
jgi:hypothetical protein